MENQELNQEKVKKMQSIVFSILCDIDEYCRENNIMYFLSGGSCLGAIRHQGFIPWDDDGDIMMPRKDFEKFIAGFSNNYKEKYGVGSLYNDPEWQRPYARIYDLSTKWESKIVNEKAMGVLVDVFPIDGVPNGRKRQKIFFKKMKILNVLRNSGIRKEYLDSEPAILLKKIIGIFVKPIGARYFAKKIDNMARHYKFEESDYVACSVPVHYGAREVISRDKMSKQVFVDFEDRQFPVPVGYDTYLSNLYGNYMIPPKKAVTNGYTHLSSWTVVLDTKEKGEK